MERNYPIITTKVDTASGYEFVSKFPDVPGVVGGGTTPDESVKEAYENLAFHLECLKEDGCTLPEATQIPCDDVSGKLNIRMSKTLHKKAKWAADLEGVSLNAFINEAVQEKVTESFDCECARKVACYSNIFEEAWKAASKTFQLNNRIERVGGYYYGKENGTDNLHKRFTRSTAAA